MSLVCGGANAEAYGVMLTGILNAGRTTWSVKNTFNSHADERNSNQVKSNLFASLTNIPMLLSGIAIGGVEGAAIAGSSALVSLMYGARAASYHLDEKEMVKAKEISENNSVFSSTKISAVNIKNLGPCKKIWSSLKASFTKSVDKIKQSDAIPAKMLTGAVKTIIDNKEKVPSAIMLARGVILLPIEPISGSLYIAASCMMYLSDKNEPEPDEVNNMDSHREISNVVSPSI